MTDAPAAPSCAPPSRWPTAAHRATPTRSGCPAPTTRYVVVTEDADGRRGLRRHASPSRSRTSTTPRPRWSRRCSSGCPWCCCVVGGTTWVVATRALAPVERIRREVEQITGDRLDRRVPEPASRDEIHRLALTMNQMLGRLEDSRDRQQQFVADASHELRSPLASIRQTAEVARAHPGALPEGELADAVLEESARMQRLVEQLLLLTRADEGAVAANRPRRRPRRPGARRGQPGTPQRARRRHAAVTAAGSGATRPRSAQVVRNLVDNAARHADAASRSPSGRPATRWSSASTTTAPGSPRTSASGSSSGSCGSTRRGPVTPAAAVSGWPSSRRSSAPTAGRSRSRPLGAGRRPVRRTASCGGRPNVLTST